MLPFVFHPQVGPELGEPNHAEIEGAVGERTELLADGQSQHLYVHSG
jgi:hypothetical protein